MIQISILKSSFLSLLLITCLVLTASCQNELIDVLYLKNGSIIKGIIIEMQPDQLVKIKTSDGSIFVFKIDEVEKVIKEEKISGNENISNQLYEKSNDKQVVQISPFPILPGPDPKYESATIRLSTEMWGVRLYLDNVYLHKIGYDRNYKITGVPPGTHSICVKTATDSIGINIKIDKEQVYTYYVKKNSIVLVDKVYKAPQQERKIDIQAMPISLKQAKNLKQEAEE